MHRKRGGALAAFLAEVEIGHIPRGSVLIVENLDRLSRENPWDALPVLCNLVNARITVVTLYPSEMSFERGSNMTALILAVAEFSRGNSESESKSIRLSEVHEQKRKNLRENGTVMGGNIPAWVKNHGGKLLLIPDRAKIVRRIFTLAIQGYGLSLIVRELTRDNVATWGRSKNGWSKTYVHKIVTSRAALGELQPKCKGQAAGEPVPDYFPAVVDESTWLQAQAAMAHRKFRTGPVGKKVATLFGGLLLDATTQGPLRIAWQITGPPKGQRYRRRFLVSARSMEGQTPAISFPSDVFEQAILKLLHEVNPADVLGKEPESESTAVAAELAVKEQRIRQIEAELTGDGHDIPALVRVLRSLSEECDKLRKQLVQLRQKESNPRSVAWAETLTLLDVAIDEPHRLRLRELLRTIIQEIRVLVIRRRSHRLVAVQVFFEGDTRRDYLIHHQASYGHPESWAARSLPPDLAPKNLDLRRKADVALMTKRLSESDIDWLAHKMRFKV